MSKIALAADFHLDSRRTNLLGDKVDPETGLSRYSIMRLNAFEEYLQLLNKSKCNKLVIIGDLFNSTVDERIKDRVFALIRKHLKKCWIIIGNHEYSRYYHTYSSLKNFEMSKTKLTIIDEPTLVDLGHHSVFMIPWQSDTKIPDEATSVFMHADPDEVKMKKGFYYVFGHIHDFIHGDKFLQLGPQFPTSYGEEANGRLCFLTDSGYEFEPCPMLFDIVEVESQEDIENNDPSRVCYRVNAGMEGLKFPQKSIRYIHFDSSAEKEEMDVGDTSSARKTLKKDMKKWMKQEKVPKKLRKLVKKRVLKTVKDVRR